MTNDRTHIAAVLAPLVAPVDYDAVRPGDELPAISFFVTAEDVEHYRDSVGTPTRRPAVAIMHLLALTLAAITDRMPLPPTCVHVGQELAWHRPVAPGSRIDIRFALLSRRTAGGSTLSAFSLHLSTDGLEVADGRILLQS